MPPNARIIHESLNGLPVEDRLSALLVSIIQSNPNALAVSLRMVSVTAALSKGLSPLNKFKVSEAMRDAADQLERHQLAHIGASPSIGVASMADISHARLVRRGGCKTPSSVVSCISIPGSGQHTSTRMRSRHFPQDRQLRNLGSLIWKDRSATAHLSKQRRRLAVAETLGGLLSDHGRISSRGRALAYQSQSGA